MNILPEYQYRPFYGLGELGSPSATIKHSAINKALLIGLDKLLPKEFNVLSECGIEPDDLVNTKIPDIIVFRTQERLNDSIPLMFIELTTSDMYKKVKAKNIEIMEKLNIRESFIYNYENFTWVKITDIKPHKTKRSYSDMFGVDLDKLISEVKYK